MIWGFLKGVFANLLFKILQPLAVYWQGRSAGRREAERKALRDDAERMEKGRQRVARGRSDSPDDRLRRNDGRWK